MLDNQPISDKADRSATAMDSRYQVQTQRLQVMSQTGHPHGQPRPLDTHRRDHSLAR